MRSTLLFGLCATLALALFLTGCKPDIASTSSEQKTPQKSALQTSPTPFKLTEIKIAPIEGSLPPGAPRVEDASGWIRQELEKEKEFTTEDKKNTSTATLHGKYRAVSGDARDGSGQVLGSVVFEMVLKTYSAEGKKLKQHETGAFVGEALPDGIPASISLKELVRKVSKEVAQSLVKQVRVAHATNEELIALLLKKDDKATLQPAIDEVRTRGLKTAAPNLKNLLALEDRDIVNIAASTLGEVGDASAVPALIESGSRVAPIDRLPMIYALGQIGGPEAKNYLETLAKHADHPAVRQAAARAIQETGGKP